MGATKLERHGFRCIWEGTRGLRDGGLQVLRLHVKGTAYGKSEEGSHAEFHVLSDEIPAQPDLHVRPRSRQACAWPQATITPLRSGERI